MIAIQRLLADCYGDMTIPAVMQENTPGFLPPGARSGGTASVLLRRKLSLHHRSLSRRGKLAQQEGRPSFARPLRLTVCGANLSARQGALLTVWAYCAHRGLDGRR